MKKDSVHDLINNAYTAFNRRDLDAAVALMDPEVHWPNGWEGGFVEGHHGVRDYWTRQWRELDAKVIPVSIQQREDGRVEVEVQQTVKDVLGNLLSDGRVTHLYTLENGSIKSMEIIHT